METRKLKGCRITLEIVYDEDQTGDPKDWNWHEVLDLGNEDVKIVKAGEFQPDPRLVEELNAD